MKFYAYEENFSEKLRDIREAELDQLSKLNCMTRRRRKEYEKSKKQEEGRSNKKKEARSKKEKREAKKELEAKRRKRKEKNSIFSYDGVFPCFVAVDIKEINTGFVFSAPLFVTAITLLVYAAGT